MDLISILATVILVVTIGTMIVGVGAYAAFKLRDKRKPAGKKSGDAKNSEEAIFLKRYVPGAVDNSSYAKPPDQST